MVTTAPLTINPTSSLEVVSKPRSIVQVVPSPLTHRGGVSDYAKILAKSLASAHELGTDFVTGDTLNDPSWKPSRAAAAILHYVNYGYHLRGTPFWLVERVNQLRRSLEGPLITIFHELFATSSWRQSTFWLKPLQKRIVRLLAQPSALCIVSSNVVAGQLRRLLPSALMVVRPVFSTFGEPSLSHDKIANRRPERWIICGGTELIRRSLRSCPSGKDLFVLGGEEQGDLREELPHDRYFPQIAAPTASEWLTKCAFGWIDYFAQPDVPTAAILKSTTFAAYCAHGVIPVFPSVNAKISLDGDAMPGPFTLGNLPAANDRPAVAQAVYDWYHRNASSVGLAAIISRLIAT